MRARALVVHANVRTSAWDAQGQRLPTINLTTGKCMRCEAIRPLPVCRSSNARHLGFKRTSSGPSHATGRLCGISCSAGPEPRSKPRRRGGPRRRGCDVSGMTEECQVGSVGARGAIPGPRPHATEKCNGTATDPSTMTTAPLDNCPGRPIVIRAGSPYRYDRDLRNLR